MNNEDKSGIIVQSLTNKLDAGKILAFAESKLVHYSYRKTAENFYKQSKYLLRNAIINLQNNEEVKINKNGRNYRLPNNTLVFYFIAKLIERRVRHLIYGLFFEKKWKVGTVNFSPNFQNNNVIDLNKVDELNIDSKYTFYADPFFSTDGKKIRLEALDKKSGLGDIIEIKLESRNDYKILLTNKHYSYPFSFNLNDSEQLLPEVAAHSSQYFINLKDNNKNYIKGIEDKRIVDSTLLKHKDKWFLFFGENDSSFTVLNLWTSNSLDDAFVEHPSSPICLSPISARMAGRILKTADGIYRFGQNNNRSYGSAITISRIDELTPSSYKESICGSISMDKALGPHSIDFNNNGLALIDYYEDKFSLFAGVRRLKSLLSKQ